MIRAVLDCNAVITAALTGGKCADLLARARRRDGFQLVWSPPIVAECLRVIEYPKLAGKFRTDPRLLVERAMASAHMVPTDLLPAIDVVKAYPADKRLPGNRRRRRGALAGHRQHPPPHAARRLRGAADRGTRRLPGGARSAVKCRPWCPTGTVRALSAPHAMRNLGTPSSRQSRAAGRRESAMQHGGDIVHLVASIPRQNGGGSEGMWGERVGTDRVRLRNTPFFVPGLSLNDVVFTARRKGVVRFAGVSLRGGHSTYWILTCAGDFWKSQWDRLRELGCSSERTKLGADRVGLAVDVPPHAPIGHVLALLAEGVAAGVWEYDEGHRGHP